ncbi:MAG: aminopeptidase P family protein [Alphaproteobacteria bacterium]
MTKASKETAPPSHLSLLRQWLKKHNFSGFFVPRGDRYLGEYVPACDERLQWVSGFSGSAGMAVVGGKKAALLVDGRYTIQAAAEVNNQEWDILPWGDDEALMAWLNAHIKGRDVGYDPHLHSEQWRRKWEKKLDVLGFTLTKIEKNNPIDGLWNNRPAAPCSELYAYKKSGGSIDNKHQKLFEIVTQHNADAVFLADPHGVNWLLNIRGQDLAYTPLVLCQALVRRDEVVLLLDPARVPDSLRSIWGDQIKIRHPQEKLPWVMPHERVLVDEAITNVADMGKLSAEAAQIIKGDDPTLILKARKTAVELRDAISVHEQDGLAVIEFLYWLKQESARRTIGELEAAAYLLQCRQQQAGFVCPSFETISGAAGNGAIVHYRATPHTEKNLQQGSLYLVDSGGQYQGGTTDITRTIAIGVPTPTMKKHYTLVLKGHLALARAVFPKGTKGWQIDILARQYLWREGLDYQHGTGHGVGSFLSVHEGPARISKYYHTAALEAGMVLSNEPGLYIEGQYGIRIENLFYIAPSPHADYLQCNSLTLVPYDISLIDVDLLEKQEIAQIQRYHQRIEEVLASRLAAPQAAWVQNIVKLCNQWNAKQ